MLTTTSATLGSPRNRAASAAMRRCTARESAPSHEHSRACSPNRTHRIRGLAPMDDQLTVRRSATYDVTVASDLDDACTTVASRQSRSPRAPGCQCPLFGADAPCKERGIANGEDDGDDPRAEREREERDLRGDDHIVRMPEEAIRSAANERLAGDGHDPGRPVRPERCNHRKPRDLECEEERQKRCVRRSVRWDRDRHRRPPCGMQDDEERILLACALDAATRQKATRIACGEEQLRGAFGGNERQHGVERAHASKSNTAKPAVKPGPSAVSNAHGPVLGANAPLRTALSSTKSTVADDMLPYSRRTARESSSAPGARPKTSSRASRTF